ncbi:FMN-binding protein [Sediminicola sp. 1XM1-17]|uniref:FMN-binding protein n=1 Tax=Sediminicola sp. 1XM1-17 TaxID=3127702 RepID=UPI0030780773
MKKITIIFLVSTLFWGCKENNKVEPPKAATVEAAPHPVQKVDPIVGELLHFADIDTAKIAAVGKILGFKAVDRSGQSTSLDLESGVALFKSFPNTKKDQKLPVMEISGTDRFIIMVKGKGFGGPIWAKLLVDQKTDEILKIRFGHRAETEGYGAQIERASFQEQFEGKKLVVSGNTFGLQKQGSVIMEGRYPIDGISGATVTNKGVVDMLNTGLQGYALYFEQ